MATKRLEMQNGKLEELNDILKNKCSLYLKKIRYEHGLGKIARKEIERN